MTNTNAAIYGPPAHQLDHFSMHFDRSDTGWSISTASGHSRTKKGGLWFLQDIETFDLDDAVSLNIAQAAYCFIADMIRDRPATQERAQFVASGGLYEQLKMF